jgi:hypothetical protein
MENQDVDQEAKDYAAKNAATTQTEATTMAMTTAEVDEFVLSGQDLLTNLATAAENLLKFSDSFEQRGGTPVFGNDALEIVYISNGLQIFLTPEYRATIARLRTDI